MKVRQLVTLAFFFAILTMVSQATTLRTSGYGADLNAALEAASNGDTILVDVPSFPTIPNGVAIVGKKVDIRGTREGHIEGRLLLTTEASGIRISHLSISGTGFSGIGADIDSPAHGITIEHCTIEGFRSGISGRFSDDWHIHHNIIMPDDVPSVPAGPRGGLLANRAGIIINAGCKYWRIHHNVIHANMKGIWLLNGAPFFDAISDILIMDNIIMTKNPQGVGVGLRAWDEYSVQSNIEIKHNDLVDVSIPVVVFASSVTVDKRADKDAFFQDASLGSGVIENLNVRKNDW